MGKLLTTSAFEAKVTNKVRRDLVAHSCGMDQTTWPWSVSLGRPSANEVRRSLAAYGEAVRDWSSYEVRHAVTVQWGVIAGQRLPLDATIQTFDDAASIAGLTDMVIRTAARALSLKNFTRCLQDSEIRAVLAAAQGLNDDSFAMALAAGEWLLRNDPKGLNCRSVPIPGFSGKWLEKNRGLVKRLVGRDDLGLVDHPRWFHYRLLDPCVRAFASQWDSSDFQTWVEGRPYAMPYHPRLVWVVENLETFMDFPTLEGGVCIYGAGRACSGFLGSVEWLHGGPDVIYWGDMDADGLEILNDYRKAGLVCRSVLMDLDSWRQWRRFGTNQSTTSTPLERHKSREVPYLTPQESGLYRLLTTDDALEYRRVEQEKIPYEFALSAACVN